MGREAYLARLALGRSAFGPPLKDENGAFVLGGQSHIHDDKSYIQQWNDRGHPVNPGTVQNALRYTKAQNEVLEACGVIIRKDKDKQRKKSAYDLSQEQSLDTLRNENKDGFLLMCADRFFGTFLTWWISALRWRVSYLGLAEKVSTFAHNSLATAIRDDFQTRPIGFLFGGFLPWMVAETARLERRPDIHEPIECMNYLQFDLPSPLPMIERSLLGWVSRLSFLPTEIFFELISTLQAFGYPVVGYGWNFCKHYMIQRPFYRPRPHTFFSDPLLHRTLLLCSRTVLLYLIRDYLYYQIGWRVYGLLRQSAVRPGHPSQLSISSAEEDQFADEDFVGNSIVGIGRSLTNVNRRFYGPTSFWSAFAIAFPWVSCFTNRQQCPTEIKRVVLYRCAQADEFNNAGFSSTDRAQKIIDNLESLGVNVEQDFYVDTAAWAQEISAIVFSMVEAPSRAPFTERAPRGRSIFVDNTWVPIPVELDDTTDRMQLRSSTPEPGIRRAVSLTQTEPSIVTPPLHAHHQITDLEPLPRRRRLTEVEDLGAHPRMRTEWLGPGPSPLGAQTRKRNSGVRRESRVTRLTVFVAESLAWHTTSVLTSLLLLPIDIVYFRSLTDWFLSLIGKSLMEPRSHVTTSGAMEPTTMRLSSLPLALLSLGLEGVVRGAVWQAGCQIALHLGRGYMWGKF